MNKSLKGALALGAAGMLLLGGAGTYARWSDAVNLNGGAINSGQLRFVDTTTGTWTDTSTNQVISDISAFRVVPGDVLSYKLSTTVRAEGENLEASLAADPSSVTGDAELLADIDVTTNVAVNGTPTSTITEANDGNRVDVTVTLAFDEASLNPTQLQSLDLSALRLTLEQNPR